MHNIKLKVEDSIYDHVMFLLNNIKSNKFEIVEDSKGNGVVKKKKLKAISLKTKGFNFNRLEANER